MSIDSKAIEAVYKFCKHIHFATTHVEAEAAIHAYHQYLESIGAKVLVPTTAKARMETALSDSPVGPVWGRSSVAREQMKAKGATTEDILALPIFVELPLGEHS